MSEGTENIDVSAMQRMLEDHEKQIEKMEAALSGMAQLVHQMDTFLREMIRAGVFELALAEIQKQKQPSKIIM